MKPFNFEEAKAGKPVCTRDGRAARIICFDADMPYPVVALVHEGGEEKLIDYGDAGQFNYSVSEHRNDLFMFSTTKTVWVNLYHTDGATSQAGVTVGRYPHVTEIAAKAAMDVFMQPYYIGTFPLTYEE